MAYLSEFAHDAFISYAHLDDEPMPPAAAGWVTTLVGGLRKLVQRKVGSRDVDIWMDPRLAGNEPLTGQLMEAVDGSAIILIVMSPSYAVSDWCRRERTRFLEVARNTVADGRVFVAHFDRVPAATMPAELRDLLGYRFWETNENPDTTRQFGMPALRLDDTQYFQVLSDLGNELSVKIAKMATAASSPAPAKSSPIAPRPVFVAEVTEDLDAKRDELIRALAQAGAAVRPTRIFPRDSVAAFTDAARADLNGAALFVQLLSGVPGRRPDDLPQGFPALQCELATAAGVPVLQWRPRDLVCSEVAHEGQRALLEGETVQASGFEDFMQAVIGRLTAPPTPPPAARVSGFVFVSRDALDRKLGDDVGTELAKEGLDVSFPSANSSPEGARLDLEGNLRDCDGVVIVYGETSALWARQQVRQARKILSQRDQAPAVFALLDGPPAQKDGLDMLLPSLTTIECRAGFDATKLRPIVAQLRR
jgi:hypothetical protein